MPYTGGPNILVMSPEDNNKIAVKLYQLLRKKDSSDSGNRLGDILTFTEILNRPRRIICHSVPSKF